MALDEVSSFENFGNGNGEVSVVIDGEEYSWTVNIDNDGDGAFCYHDDAPSIADGYLSEIDEALEYEWGDELNKE